jgi:hypothetical protein
MVLIQIAGTMHRRQTTPTTRELRAGRRPRRRGRAVGDGRAARAAGLPERHLGEAERLAAGAATWSARIPRADRGGREEDDRERREDDESHELEGPRDVHGAVPFPAARPFRRTGGSIAISRV